MAQTTGGGRADLDLIEAARAHIDRLDDRILGLLHRRLALARRIGTVKEHLQDPAWVPWREKEVLSRLVRENRGRFPEDSLRHLFTEIFSASRRAERPLTVAYHGLPGALTHAAAARQFGHTTRLVPAGSIEELFETVAAGRADYGVVPPEVSCEGIVTHALEYFLRSDLTICAETYLPLAIVLATWRTDDRVRRVFVQPQVYSFVREWLGQHLGLGVRIEMAGSSCEAAGAARRRRGAACLVPPFTARHFDLAIVEPSVPYGPPLRLRFLTAGRQTPRPSASDKTTIAFALADKVGAISEAIAPFGRHRISISFLESYPSSRASPTVTFFADIVGHVEDDRLGRAVGEMRASCSYVKVLGSYPVFRGEGARR